MFPTSVEGAQQPIAWISFARSPCWIAHCPYYCQLTPSAWHSAWEQWRTAPAFVCWNQSGGHGKDVHCRLGGSRLNNVVDRGYLNGLYGPNVLLEWQSVRMRRGIDHAVPWGTSGRCIWLLGVQLLGLDPSLWQPILLASSPQHGSWAHWSCQGFRSAVPDAYALQQTVARMSGPASPSPQGHDYTWLSVIKSPHGLHQLYPSSEERLPVDRHGRILHASSTLTLSGFKCCSLSPRHPSGLWGQMVQWHRRNAMP